MARMGRMARTMLCTRGARKEKGERRALFLYREAIASRSTMSRGNKVTVLLEHCTKT